MLCFLQLTYFYILNVTDCSLIFYLFFIAIFLFVIFYLFLFIYFLLFILLFRFSHALSSTSYYFDRDDSILSSIAALSLSLECGQGIDQQNQNNDNDDEIDERGERGGNSERNMRLKASSQLSALMNYLVERE